MVPMSLCDGFAVLDFETTGLSPAKGDRAIEVGVVHVAPDGTLEDEVETLIHVQRDLGPQSLHHISAAELMQAPDFAGIARSLGAFLEHRVFVAHNAQFDSGFLNREYERLGYRIPVDDSDTICTLKLARRILGVGGLSKCCARCGIENADAHSALSDARATAELLGIFMKEDPRWTGWQAMMAGAAEQDWPRITEGDQEWMPRRSHTRHDAAPYYGVVPSEPPARVSTAPTDASRSADDTLIAPVEAGGVDTTLMEIIASRCTAHPRFAADPGSVMRYLRLLDDSMVSASLSLHERIALADLASQLQLSQEECANAHEQYFHEVAQAAWEDGAPNAHERQRLLDIGHELTIPGTVIDHATADTLVDAPIDRISISDDIGRPVPLHRPFELCEGDHLVLTGAMSRQRGEWEGILRSLGLVPRNAVSRKTQLVIAADPDSESTKARKARSYHIPIVDEAWLEDAISDGIAVTANDRYPSATSW